LRKWLSAVLVSDIHAISSRENTERAMGLREKVNSALKQAMKEKDKTRLATLRLINAAIKDQDIALRGTDSDSGLSEADILSILGKLTKQRQESVRAYEEGGRLDLAEREQEEIAIIAEFLPRQLSADEVTKAVQAAIQATDASTIRDMGKVMGHLKTEFTGRMDFGAVGPMVKDQLARPS
jgi:uncharacterized protein YqeY